MKLKRFSHLTLLWLMAIAISSITFSQIYGEVPSVSDIIIGTLIYGVLALPFSFLHSIMFQGTEALRIFGFSFIILVLSYWIILFGSQIVYIRRGGKCLFLVCAVIVLISSFRWLYYAMAMSGI